MGKYLRLRNLPLGPPPHQPRPKVFLCLFSSRSVEEEFFKIRRRRKEDPFHVLGVPEGTAYTAVKKRFLQLAMQHHPDVRGNSGTAEDAEASREIFISARKAFEALVEGPGGEAILRISQQQQSDQEMNDWFRTETGHDLPYMDPQTMREVAKMTEVSSIGLDRDGGMWTLARMVTESVKSGGNGQDILRLEAGDVRDSSIDGILRRRKRR